MKKVIKITERDLEQIVKKVLSEQRNYVQAQPILSKGQRGEEVRKFQEMLLNMGYDLGSTGADGIFGSRTQAAVMKFQKTHNLKQTGQIDQSTRNLLNMAPAGSPFGKKTPSKKDQQKVGEKPKAKPAVSEKQKNINNLYCASEGGIIRLKSSVFNGTKWNDYVKRYKITDDEIKIAQKSCPKPAKQEYKLTPRIDNELQYIKERGLDDQPFFIYDPEQNLIYLFNKGGVLVDYSSVVDGADAQKDATPMTIDDWCKISGHDSTPHKCTDKSTKQPTNPSYSALAKIENRFLPKGIYSINRIATNAGYVGGANNVFLMKDSGGKDVAAAIHGIPNIEGRLTASKDLEEVLKKDIASGKVPKQFLNAAKKIANANQSFGCVGVPAKFIANPNVQKLAKGARVFVMGEGRDYLVQNATQFFDKLGGDGENCVNPNSLASRMATTA